MRVTNKRKRQEKNNDDTEHLSQSLSQLSVSQPKVKKQATTEAMTVTEKEDPLPYNHIRRYKPSYLKVPDHVFVRMLAKAITGGDEIIKYLNTTEKIASIRQMIELTNDLNYIDLQRQFWQAHYNVGLKEGFCTVIFFEILGMPNSSI